MSFGAQIGTEGSAKEKVKAIVRIISAIRAGVHMKAVLSSAFLPISRSHFKQRKISKLTTITTVRRFCANFWVIFGHFGKELFFLKG